MGRRPSGRRSRTDHRHQLHPDSSHTGEREDLLRSRVGKVGPRRSVSLVASDREGRDPMREIMNDLDRWRAQGRRVAIARVVDIEGSGPRLPGAAMAVADDGEVAGSVSGGCVEGAVVTEALQVLESGDRRLVTFGYSDDEAFAVGLTCGGTVHLFIEPLDW